MFFLSQLQKIKVLDVVGRQAGALKDLVASLKEKYPLVTGIIVSTARHEELCIPWSQVRSFEESQILLAKSIAEIAPSRAKTDEILLVKDVLDKQIIDTEGRKLIRVQDIQLARIDSRIRVIAVDVSGKAVFRRLGLSAVSDRLAGRLTPRYIDWSNVDLIGSGVPAVKLKVSHDKLSLLHPADIADIVNELSPEHRTALLESLNKEVAADTVEEMNPPYQADVFSEMEPRKAAEILKEMEPDDAADLLADLPDEKAAELLSLIKKEEADELRELLQHPESSAGGIMTTEFVAIPANLTVQEVIERLRKLEPDAETIYYVYVVDKEEHLLGVLSLRKMIVSSPDTKITDIMNTSVIKVGVADEQEQVTKLIAKYNLLAIPVVDEENHLQGIVTVDDAIDVVIPTAWKKRFSRIYE
jgi:CBS domain-containing protein/sporulation protein YlmC with PRC-barrel domain